MDEILESVLTDLVETLQYAKKRLTLDELREQLHENSYVDFITPKMRETLRWNYEKDYWQYLEGETMTVELTAYESVEEQYFLRLYQAVYTVKIDEAIEHLQKVIGSFCEYLHNLNGRFWGKAKPSHFQVLSPYLELTLTCPHGWAAHNDEVETEEGLYLYRWLSGQLDGLNAISLKTNDIWITLTIDPNRNFSGDLVEAI